MWRSTHAAVVLVGERKDSQTYVNSKKKGCAEVGFESFGTDLSENASEDMVLQVRDVHLVGLSDRLLASSSASDLALIQVVQAYNNDPKVHGILVQLPLPKHINERRILDAISIEKDVDGFHPANIGCLGMRGRDPLFVPCTPKVNRCRHRT